MKMLSILKKGENYQENSILVQSLKNWTKKEE